MKKRMIWGIALALLAAVSLTACGGKNTGGGDTPYPYSWAESSDGSVALTIKGTPEEGYAWTAEGSDLLEITRTETGFAISATETEVAGVATFTLETEGALPNQAYEITLSLEANSKGRLEVQDSSSQALEANASAGEDTEAPYQWRYDAAQGLLVYVTTTDRTWQVTVDNHSEDETDDTFYAVGPSYDEGGFLLTLGGRVETGTVTLKGAECGLAITLEVEQEADGALTLVSHSQEAWKRQKSDITGLEELEDRFGTLGVPAGVVLTACSTAVWSEADEVNATVGDVYFQQEGEERSLFLASGAAQEDLMEELMDEDMETETREAGGRSVTVWSYEDEYTAFWTGDNGIVYALSMDGVTLEDVLSAAEDWMEAQNG